MTITSSIFSNLPNNLIMDIIKIETDRALEEQIKNSWKDDFKFVVNQMKELNEWMEEDYERDDMDRWGLEKVSLDFWGKIDILSYDEETALQRWG